MKKRYRLKKEVKAELVQLGIEVLGIITMISMVILLIIINGIMF